MNNTLLAPWIRRFLLEHIIAERNLACNTQRSYRDTLRLFLPFAAERVGKPLDRLDVEDLKADHLRFFLQNLEKNRGCGVATRNQRLAAIHSLAHFVAKNSPEHIDWCAAIRNVPFKKAPRPLVTYLEKEEMDALLGTPDVTTHLGRRDHALLLFLYNTGSRADEVAHVMITDLHIGMVPGRDPSSVVIRGKGNKLRQCPLWTRTVGELTPLVGNRPPDQRVFLNRCGQPMTRFGVHAMVQRNAIAATARMPSMARKRISPHTIRHYLPFRTMSGNARTFADMSENCRSSREEAHPFTRHSFPGATDC